MATPAALTLALTAAEVEIWRRRFPILQRCTYLINNSLGAMPDTVPASLAEFTDAWATLGVEAWRTEWLPEVRRVADLLAGLLGAPSGSVVVHQNVATLTAMVLSALDYTPARNKIVLTDIEWPGHHYLFAGQRRLGATVEVVATDGIGVDVARLLEAIDASTALVAISHVVYRSGHINDVAAVCARARDVGALVLVDGYHAVGHLPVDVAEIDADFYTGGSVKWLCGGPGVGYLYIRPELATTLAPRDVGWLGHAQPFAFNAEFEPAQGAMGWLGGTPGIPSLYAAREGYRIIAEVGPERIRATTQGLVAHLVDGARARGLGVVVAANVAARGGGVTLDVGAATQAAGQRLIAEGIVVDYRPGAGIRVGAHFFNTISECDLLLDTLAGYVDAAR